MRPPTIFLRSSLVAWAALAVLSSAAFAAPKKKPAAPAAHPTHARPISLKPPPAAVAGTPASAQAPASSGGAPQRGPTRLDFDDRLIQGQTNRSGAVYLYDRKELKNRSMIKTPDSFRQQIVGAVYDSP
jgi:hypothetical protein